MDPPPMTTTTTTTTSPVVAAAVATAEEEEEQPQPSSHYHPAAAVAASSAEEEEDNIVVQSFDGGNEVETTITGATDHNNNDNHNNNAIPAMVMVVPPSATPATSEPEVTLTLPPPVSSSPPPPTVASTAAPAGVLPSSFSFSFSSDTNENAPVVVVAAASGGGDAAAAAAAAAVPPPQQQALPEASSSFGATMENPVSHDESIPPPPPAAVVVTGGATPTTPMVAVTVPPTTMTPDEVHHQPEPPATTKRVDQEPATAVTKAQHKPAAPQETQSMSSVSDASLPVAVVNVIGGGGGIGNNNGGDGSQETDSGSEEGLKKPGAGQPQPPPTAEPYKPNPFFRYMAQQPLPFLVIIPLLFLILTIAGWTKPDMIDDDITQLSLSESVSYAQDRKYAKRIGVSENAASSFSAMVLARKGFGGKDNNNVMTPSRLEAIRYRMEETESITVEYKGHNYTWDDICYSVVEDPYVSPCLRLSPMDLYEEAGWYYKEQHRLDFYRLVHEDLIHPRLIRFGAMMNDCGGPCFRALLIRQKPEMLGLPSSYRDPMGLFMDLSKMEMSDPCRICIENYTSFRIEEIYTSIDYNFQVLAQELQRYADANPEEQQSTQALIQKLQHIRTTTTIDDAEQFFAILVLRGAYISLGAPIYIKKYNQDYTELVENCQEQATALGLTCPILPANVTVKAAEEALRQHVDGPYSSIATSGAPFPLWSSQDGLGTMFGNNPTTPGQLYPVGGSGLNMSSPMSSLRLYLDSLNYGNRSTAGAWNPMYGTDNLIDPKSEMFQTMVEKNPVYAWFMSGLEPADPSTVCQNGILKGTDTISQALNADSARLAKKWSEPWCTKYNRPNPDHPIQKPDEYTKQDIARMWFTLLVDSSNFLQLKQGEDNPYTFTAGLGCGYKLSGSRYSYHDQTEDDILNHSSRIIYNVDEGTAVGPVNRQILMGGVVPDIDDYNATNPLKRVQVFQTLYAALTDKGIVERVQDCRRPGGPLNISVADAQNILSLWKETMQDTWTRGWDNDENELQFVGFFDDTGGADGSMGRAMDDVAGNSTSLMMVAIVVIGLFTVLFSFFSSYSGNLVHSRMLVTLIGFVLALFSFLAGQGFGLLLGIKLNLASSWTLPFVIIGVGVDNIYIVLSAVKKQGGYTEQHWHQAMSQVIIPITMTSLVNAFIFIILISSDVPAVYQTSQVACFCILALYAAVVFCFMAYTYVDLKRQVAGRLDVLFCITTAQPVDLSATERNGASHNGILFESFYKQIVLNPDKNSRSLSHFVIAIISVLLLVIGGWGITQHDIGLGLAELFPKDNPSSVWATTTDDDLAAWSVFINWGALDYKDPTTQLKMLKQFEDVVATPHINNADTRQLWLARVLIWSSRHCTTNFARDHFDRLECGRDQEFEPESFCAGSWVPNELGLREKFILDLADPGCVVFQEGICRPGQQMHPDDLIELGLNADTAANKSFCPVIQGWSDEKWKFCLETWRNITNAGVRFVLEEGTATPTDWCKGVYNNDDKLHWPLPYSTGPLLLASGLYSREDTETMMRETRAVCDDNAELHCWMSGPPFDLWTPYEDISNLLFKLSLYAVIVGFAVSLVFFTVRFALANYHPKSKVILGGLIGSLLIATTMILSLVCIIGFSVLAGVNLTALSSMAFVLSVGFSVEYSVHIVSRFMCTDMSISGSLERVQHTMSFLMLPSLLSFVSCTIGIICLAFLKYDFNKTYFFRPLIIMILISYWFGCWFLPMVLTYLDFDMVKLGKPVDNVPPATKRLPEG